MFEHLKGGLGSVISSICSCDIAEPKVQKETSVKRGIQRRLDINNYVGGI